MTEVIDQYWYDRYEAAQPATEMQQYLRTVPDIDNQKTVFIKGGFEQNPDLTPVVNLDEVRRAAEGYLALRYDLAASDAPEVVKDAYLPVVAGRLAEVTMGRRSCPW